MYGHAVSLTYQGEETFRTRFGAASTIIVMVVLLFFAVFTLFQLKDPLLALPVKSTISRKKFYEIFSEAGPILNRDGSFSELESQDKRVRPLQFFAFGLGIGDKTPISENIGSFVVKSNKDGATLPIVPCTENKNIQQHHKRSLGDSFSALFCLADYSEYAFEVGESGDYDPLEISFEAC